MHNYQFINFLINSTTDEPFHKYFLKEWFICSIENSHDAMGVFLMGGEI